MGKPSPRGFFAMKLVKIGLLPILLSVVEEIAVALD